MRLSPIHTGLQQVSSTLSEKFKVVIEAHADEISWFVNYISTEGLIYL
jgi:putative aminopeptidase FrvX